MSEYCHNCKNLADENAKLKRHNDVLVTQREQAYAALDTLVEACGEVQPWIYLTDQDVQLAYDKWQAAIAQAEGRRRR